jgi:hypothetical protein
MISLSPSQAPTHSAFTKTSKAPPISTDLLLLHSNRPATNLAHRLPRRPKHGRPHRTHRPNSHSHLKSRFTGRK